MIAAAALLLGFIVVRVVRFFDERAVANAGEAAYAAPPPVDVVTAKPVTAGQELALPGQTAAWYESIIYARVNGYVAKWLVDIGDHVKRDQLLATIETPELDAELAAARSQLKTSQAQVIAREAEAELARTTNERWRDSPKGVVSEQEREEKKADYDSASARLFAANAQVALDQSRVDQYTALTQFKQVRAPFDGVITERKIDLGNLVTAGSTLDDDASLSDHAEPSTAGVRGRAAECGAGVDEAGRSGAGPFDRLVCGRFRGADSPLRRGDQSAGAHHARGGGSAERQ